MPQRLDRAPWRAVLPRKWPDPPSEMSVSALRELEACPRRWALTAADYPELWDRRGYPPKIQLSALAGTVVHLAVEEVTKALVYAGCASAQSAQAVSVMRELGGYSTLLGSCIHSVLASHDNNPRAAHLLEAAARTLNTQVPDMRAHLQALLGRVRLDRTSTGRDGKGTGAGKRRGPLGPGVYPELEVRARDIGWRGRSMFSASRTLLARSSTLRLASRGMIMRLKFARTQFCGVKTWN